MGRYWHSELAESEGDQQAQTCCLVIARDEQRAITFAVGHAIKHNAQPS